MGKAYDKVMESRKELTKQLLAEMEHGKLVWVQGWDNTGKLDLCQYFEHKKLKGYADFFNSSSSFCCGVI